MQLSGSNPAKTLIAFAADQNYQNKISDNLYKPFPACPVRALIIVVD